MNGPVVYFQNHEWLAAKHFAEGVGVCLSTVYKWAAEGKIETTKIGSLKLVRLDMDLASFRTLLRRVVPTSVRSRG